MQLIETATGNNAEAIIEPVSPGDYKVIKKSKRFPNFNWDKEKGKEVLKIRLKNSDEILGLMSLTDHKTESWIEINLLESSDENIGDEKEYDKIAGCLIAHACKQAFIKGYDGTVALLPKTVLAEHYKVKYGLRDAGKNLFTALQNSEHLINEYLT